MRRTKKYSETWDGVKEILEWQTGDDKCWEKMRVGLAQRVLVESDLPLSKVAARCDFPSLARFNATFAKYHKEPPARWRAEQSMDMERY